MSHNSIQYCVSINNNEKYLNEDKIKEFEINNILQIKINKIEKIRGIFIYVPLELDGYIDKIVFNLKNQNTTKTIYIKNENYFEQFEQSEQIQIFKQNDLFTIYWIGINSLDINPYNHDFEDKLYCLTELTDSIDIFFDSSINDLDDLIGYINNISFDLIVKNYLIGTNYNQMLKFVDGKINLELESDWIGKYNQSLDEKIKNIISKYIELNKATDMFTLELLKQNPEHFNIEKYLKNENLIYLIKKYIELY